MGPWEVLWMKHDGSNRRGRETNGMYLKVEVCWKRDEDIGQIDAA